MRICVFETGIAPEGLRDKHPTYPEMAQKWLSPFLPEASFAFISVINGEDLPDVTDYDGYIIMGSKHGVYENLKWMHDLSKFLQKARDAGQPIFGICFGHQIMAHAFGGVVEKSNKGWAVGAALYSYEPQAGMNNAPAFVYHQDQVTRKPPNSEVIGGNDHCPIGALVYDFPALSVQYHPEFDQAYVSALLEGYKGTILSEDLALDGLTSLEALSVDNTPLAQKVAGFFQTVHQKID